MPGFAASGGASAAGIGATSYTASGGYATIMVAESLGAKIDNASVDSLVKAYSKANLQMKRSQRWPQPGAVFGDGAIVSLTGSLRSSKHTSCTYRRETRVPFGTPSATASWRSTESWWTRLTYASLLSSHAST